MARRGRGLDFEHRFNTSRWAEDRALEALNQGGLPTLRLGLSGYSRDNRISTVKGDAKVPDLLVLDGQRLTSTERGLLEEIGFDLRAHASDALRGEGDFGFVLPHALQGIEVEFSPYRASEMTHRNWRRRDAEDLARRPRKHANPPTAPNIFVKEEDVLPLLAWQSSFRIPVTVLHLFDQEAFAIGLNDVFAFRSALLPLPASDAVQLQLRTGIFRKEQGYDRTDAQGAREVKTVYMITPAASMKAGEVTGVDVRAQLGVSSSGKYVATVLFQGGSLCLSREFLDYLRLRRPESTP